MNIGLIIYNILFITLAVCYIIGVYYLSQQHLRDKKPEDFSEKEKSFMKLSIIFDWISIGLVVLSVIFIVLVYFKLAKIKKNRRIFVTI